MSQVWRCFHIHYTYRYCNSTVSVFAYFKIATYRITPPDAIADVVDFATAHCRLIKMSLQKLVKLCKSLQSFRFQSFIPISKYVKAPLIQNSFRLSLTWGKLKDDFIVGITDSFHDKLIEEMSLFYSAPWQNMTWEAYVFTQDEIQLVSGYPEDTGFAELWQCQQ